MAEILLKKFQQESQAYRKLVNRKEKGDQDVMKKKKKETRLKKKKVPGNHVTFPARKLATDAPRLLRQQTGRKPFYGRAEAT
jgi:hypothetical protein